MGWQSIVYHFQVTVTLTLTSDLVFKIIVSGAYLIVFEVGIPNLVWIHLGMAECLVPPLGHCDLDIDL